MTRINVVPVEELVDMHLIAEYRELPRIFSLSLLQYETGRPLKAPSVYILGSGHVLFFYNKLKWLVERQSALVDEMKRRGFNTTFNIPQKLVEGMPPERMGDYVPTSEAMAINRQRIAERIIGSRKRVTYMGNDVDISQYESLV